MHVTVMVGESNSQLKRKGERKKGENEQKSLISGWIGSIESCLKKKSKKNRVSMSFHYMTWCIGQARRLDKRHGYPAKHAVSVSLPRTLFAARLLKGRELSQKVARTLVTAGVLVQVELMVSLSIPPRDLGLVPSIEDLGNNLAFLPPLLLDLLRDLAGYLLLLI